MKERTLRILEFNKIKDKVEKYAITSSGKEMVHSLEPFKSTYEVEKKTGYSSAALVELKNGKKDCRLSTIINLCDAFDITVEEFFEGATFKI